MKNAEFENLCYDASYRVDNNRIASQIDQDKLYTDIKDKIYKF